MKATEERSKKVKYKMNIAIEILQTQKKRDNTLRNSKNIKSKF